MKSEIASEKQTDLDKSVKEIEELLSQKYGSSPYESSVNYDQSDSDFNPWESSCSSEGNSPDAPNRAAKQSSQPKANAQRKRQNQRYINNLHI